MLLRQLQSTAWMCILMVLGSFVAAEEGREVHIGELFRNALGASSQPYVAIRSSILSEMGAKEFLSKRADDTNVLSRVLARAMLSWAANPATNAWRQTELRNALGAAARFHGSVFVTIQRAIMATKASWSEPDGGTSAPLFLEIVLKGATLDEVTFASGEPTRQAPTELWFRCLAVARVVASGDRDAVPVFNEVVRSAKEYQLRACAVAGLRKIGGAAAVEPLIETLADTNDEVRKSAQFGLKELTGQDFGTDRVKYEDWWQKNRGHVGR